MHFAPGGVFFPETERGGPVRGDGARPWQKASTGADTFRLEPAYNLGKGSCKNAADALLWGGREPYLPRKDA